LVVGQRCAAVIDSGGTPALGQAWRETVQRLAAVPVCYVINTHAHPDHILGNVAFTPVQPRPQFVASARFAAMLAARAPYYRNALQRDFGVALEPAAIIYPDLVVAQSLTLDLGDRLLTLQAWPTAHTDNDLTVFDARTHTLIAGDLLFAQHLPALDGSLRGWLCDLQSLRALDVSTVVPGHGPVSQDWPAVLDAQRAYLQALLHDTRTAIGQGWTLQQAVDRIAHLAGARWLLADHFQRRNVTAAYAELEWEEGVAACKH
jgi:quinoprotein relay system zinc metallohydrolase 2